MAMRSCENNHNGADGAGSISAILVGVMDMKDIETKPISE